MLKFIIGGFLVLHGLVHLLYFGQSGRFFELQPGLTWPQGSWAFSKLVGDWAVCRLASLALALAALGYVTGGAALLFRQAWWSPVVVCSALFSTLIFLLFWDGWLQRLDSQGAVGILINLGFLSAVLLFRFQIASY